MVDTRAIVFDLDDTLYPLEGFVRSGFQAVARRIEQEHGVSGWSVLRALCRASRLAPGRELQHLCERVGLPPSEVTRFVRVMRCHTPRLRLPAETIQVLATLRAGWRIGVLTNGQPAMQRRKVAALGLQAHVDAIVFANECGDGRGKPDPSAFRAVLDRLAASPERSVFVGDDLDADLVGASRAGMHAIHLTAHRPIPSASAACRVRVDCLREVPLVAAQLVQGGDRVGIV